jgi:hypothetical protein
VQERSGVVGVTFVNESQRATGAVEIVSEQQADGSYELKLQSKELHLPEGGLRPPNRTGSSKSASDGGSATWMGLLAVAALLVVGGYFLFVSPQGDERDPLADTPSATVGGPRVGSLRPPPAPNPAPRAVVPGAGGAEYEDPNEAAALDFEDESGQPRRSAYEGDGETEPGVAPDDERPAAAVRGARPSAAPPSARNRDDDGAGAGNLEEIDRFDEIDPVGEVDDLDSEDPRGPVGTSGEEGGEDELADDEFERDDEYDDEEEFVDDDEFEGDDEYDDEEEFVDDDEFED